MAASALLPPLRGGLRRQLYLSTLRYNNRKVHFPVKDDGFAGAMLRPTVPRPVNLRIDPLEQHMDAPAYPLHAGEKLWTVLPAAALSISTPRRQRTFHPGHNRRDFTPQRMLERVMQAAAGQ
jgi:arylsulfatase